MAWASEWLTLQNRRHRITIAKFVLKKKSLASSIYDVPSWLIRIFNYWALAPVEKSDYKTEWVARTEKNKAPSRGARPGEQNLTMVHNTIVKLCRFCKRANRRLFAEITQNNFSYKSTEPSWA